MIGQGCDRNGEGRDGCGRVGCSKCYPSEEIDLLCKPQDEADRRKRECEPVHASLVASGGLCLLCNYYILPVRGTR